MSAKVWQIAPPGYMGPGELVLHMVQANKFNAGWLSTVLDRQDQPFGTNFDLDPMYAGLVGSWNKLSELNLAAARSGLAKFQSLGQLVDAWDLSRVKSRKVLASIAEDNHNLVVEHPLISLDVEVLPMVCQELFIRYSDHCAGLIAQQLLSLGAIDRVPFMFGRT
jgi:hypothetical protein